MNRTLLSWAGLRVFLPYALGFYLSYLLRMANAVLTPELSRDLGISAAELGLVTSAYFLSFAAFQLPLGMLLDRFGPRRVNALLLLFAAAGCAGFGAARDLPSLLAARALIGFGVSACLMAAFKSLQQWFPAERQPSLVTATMTFGALGALSASVPIELALPTLGWRGIYFALALAELLLAGLLLATPDSRNALAADGFRAALSGTATILKSRLFWRYAPLATAVGGGIMALQGLWAVPWLMSINGVSRAVAAQHLLGTGIATLCGYLVLTFGLPAMTRIGLGPGRLFAGGMALATLCGLLMLGEWAPSPVLWVLLGLAASTNNLGYGLISSHFPAHMSGRANTAYNLVVFVGAFLLQWGFGLGLEAFADPTRPDRAMRYTFATLVGLQCACYGWYLIAQGARADGENSASTSAPVKR